MTAVDTSAQKFGPIWLSPGVSRGNMGTLLYAAFFTIGLLTFVGIGTPYVLNAVLKIPAEEQGVVSGNLVFWTEIASILLFGPIGVLVDKFGRRALYVVGFGLMGLGYALYPFAGSITELTIYRMIYALGIATTTGVLATVVTDYPQEGTRGKAVAIVGFMNGLGVAVLNIILGGMPQRFSNAGFDDVTAGEYTHFIVAGLCWLSAIVCGLGLKGGLPGKHKERPAARLIVREALRAAVTNPRIALAYTAAFIARGDLVILGTFLTLWATQAGVASGMALPEASRAGTLIFVTAQSAALLWTGVVVFLLDRFNRVTALAWCMGIAAAGYLGMGFVDDPLARIDLPLIILLGVGQISAFFGSQALVGQEAPVLQRGAVLGGFNTSGAIGILFCSTVGGYLYDNVGPHGPFVLVGCLNLVVFALCLIVRRLSPGRMPGEGPASVAFH
ncbi:MAG: MFS transporter [Rhodospirillaceae bacterium]|nr:MFS transporter [Rhodospirillaceae bacterium]